jgi:hypothetical protein
LPAGNAAARARGGRFATDQRLSDRLLRVGTADLDTAGTEDSDLRLVGIANPGRVPEAVDRALRDQATRAS